MGAGEYVVVGRFSMVVDMYPIPPISAAR